MQLRLDVRQYRMSAVEERRLRGDAERLRPQVEHFPVADLHMLVEGNARTNDVSVKLSLILPGTTLIGNDHDLAAAPACERAMGSLIEGLRAYKDRLGKISERQKSEKGTQQALHSPVDLDPTQLDFAVEARDYTAFRMASFALEEGLRKRVGRWIQRYPDLQERVGHGLEVSDVVEEVFLLAFENYPHRPSDIPFGTWIVTLIDPAARQIRHRGDEEVENVRLAQTARTAEQGPAAV
jgi:hypothetical protein